MRRHDTRAVADAADEAGGEKVHRQLHAEIHRRDQGDLLQGQRPLLPERQEEQRGQGISQSAKGRGEEVVEVGEKEAEEGKDPFLAPGRVSKGTRAFCGSLPLKVGKGLK